MPRIPDDLTVTPAEAVSLGGSLLAEGRPFHAHEVFEAAWKAAPEPERELWRGLAQIAVGLTHARRGNAHGAVTLLRRGAARIRGYPALYGADPEFVAASADEIALRIARDGLPAVPPADLRLALSRSPGWTRARSRWHRRSRRCHLGRGEREPGVGHADRGGEDHAVDGARRTQQRAA